MQFERVMIVIAVSSDAVDRVLGAIAAAGGGVIGEYTHCAYVISGEGRFKASDAANPHTGAAGQINAMEEARIETFCERSHARKVVAAIREAHPYEEPVIYMLPLLNESDL